MIKDHDGSMIASLAQQLNQAYKPVEIAATRAIDEFAEEVGVDKVLIEGDSSVVTEALRSKNIG